VRKAVPAAQEGKGRLLDRFGGPQESLSCPREPISGGGLGEEPKAELILQRRNAPAERGCARAQPLRGRGKAARADDRQEGLQVGLGCIHHF
jgi:hypothetical protein